MQQALGDGAAAAVAKLREQGAQVGSILNVEKRKSIHLARRPQRFLSGNTSELSPYGIEIDIKAAQDGKSGDVVTQSIRTLPEVLDTGARTGTPAGARALRNGILDEYKTFLEQVGAAYGFHPISGKQGFIKILQALQKEAENGLNDDDREFWQSVEIGLRVLRAG